MSESNVPEGFDPRYQLLNYTSFGGQASITFAEIDWYVHILLKNAIIYASRVGASGIAMVILFIVSKNRKTPVFILNQICLACVVIHSSLYFSYLLGSFASTAWYFTGFTDLLITNSAKNISNATTFFHFLTMSCIEVSMVFQIRTIFQGPDMKWLSRSVVSLSVGIALSVIGLCLYNFTQFAQLTFSDPEESYFSPAMNALPILFASSVNFMSVLLVTKLIMAVRSRRYLGLKQFDGFHILLIMSTQTLIIPSILVVISYAVDSLSKIAFTSICTGLVALSLPLSSMWASSSNNAPSPSSAGFHTYSPSGRGTSFYSEQDAATLKLDFESSKKMYDLEKSLYTPSTAAEEEAKRYWMSDDLDGEDDSQFIGRTIHHLNATVRE